MKLMKTVSEILERPYARLITRDESGAYIATIREFQGCVADGSSAAEAFERLQRAAEAWLEAVIALKQDIPEPYVEPDASGKILLRLPRAIHQRAIERAELEETSVNQLLVAAVSYYLGVKSVESDALALLRSTASAVHDAVQNSLLRHQAASMHAGVMHIHRAGEGRPSSSFEAMRVGQISYGAFFKEDEFSTVGTAARGEALLTRLRPVP